MVLATAVSDRLVPGVLEHCRHCVGTGPEGFRRYVAANGRILGPTKIGQQLMRKKLKYKIRAVKLPFLFRFGLKQVLGNYSRCSQINLIITGLWEMVLFWLDPEFAGECLSWYGNSEKDILWCPTTAGRQPGGQLREVQITSDGLEQTAACDEVLTGSR